MIFYTKKITPSEDQAVVIEYNFTLDSEPIQLDDAFFPSYGFQVRLIAKIIDESSGAVLGQSELFEEDFHIGTEGETIILNWFVRRGLEALKDAQIYGYAAGDITEVLVDVYSERMGTLRQQYMTAMFTIPRMIR